MLRKDPFVTGEYYHIFNRGVDKRSIFASLADYRRFTMLLYIANSPEPIRLDNLLNEIGYSYEEILFYERGAPLISIGAWCLMPNHFHLLVREASEGGITKFIKKLCTAYSMFFNLKNERTGPLFSGPFKAKLVGEDDYLKHLFGYIHLNPLDIKFSGWQESISRFSSKDLQNFLSQYSHSSYRDYVGVDRVEKSILSTADFPEYFSSKLDFKDFVSSYFDAQEFLQGQSLQEKAKK